MSSERSFTAVKSPNFLVTCSNVMYGLACVSFHGAKLLRMLPSDFMSRVPVPILRLLRRRRQEAGVVKRGQLLARDDLGPKAGHHALGAGVVRNVRKQGREG